MIRAKQGLKHFICSQALQEAVFCYAKANSLSIRLQLLQNFYHAGKQNQNFFFAEKCSEKV